MTGFISRRLSNFPAVEQELVRGEVLGPIFFSLNLESWQGWVYKLHQGYKCQDLSSTAKIQKCTKKHGKVFGGAATFETR